MISVDGERVWVPSNKRELIDGLKRMGIQKVAGVPLQQLSHEQLVKAYCRERAQIVRRQHHERRGHAEQESKQRTYDAATCQLKLFAA
ncbi:MAG: hypothetical protein IPK16_20725 [Anaerolineales bacterium]|nr:hypothetical protein [Anaerolineales bacterium]